MHSVFALSSADVVIYIGFFQEGIEDALDRLKLGEKMRLFEQANEYSMAIIGNVDCTCCVECRMI
jgi:hypothetical protein